MSKFLKNMLLASMLMLGGQAAFAEQTTPTSDFVDNGDGTVTHKKTGLTWMRCLMGQIWTGSACSGEASQYDWNEAKVLKSDFAGNSNWRLPNIDELLSIIEKASEKPAINTTIFPNVPMIDNSYSRTLSSSPYASDSNYARFVDFSEGFDDVEYNDLSYFVRFVRGGQWFSGHLAEENKKLALEAKKEKLAKAKEEKCMRTPKCRAKKEREERQ